MLTVLFFNIRLSVFHGSYFRLLITSKMTTVFLKREFPILCHTGILPTKFSVAIRRHTAAHRRILDERQAFLRCFYSEPIHCAEKMSPHGCKYFTNGQIYRKIPFSLPIVKLKDKYPVSRGNATVLPLTLRRKFTLKIYYSFKP